MHKETMLTSMAATSSPHLLDGDHCPWRDLVEPHKDPELEEHVNHDWNNAHKDDDAFFVCLQTIMAADLQDQSRPTNSLA